MLWTALLLTAAGAPAVDALLPDHLRPAIEAAAEAELDPKRGPGNAKEILERVQREVARSPRDQMSVQLRLAALELRRTFLAESKLERSGRHEQALSTYSRLDLTEPGFAEWLDRTLDHHPEVQASLEASNDLKISVLSRGPVGREELQEALRAAFAAADLGVDLELVTPRRAEYLLKVTTENMTRDGRAPAVGVTVVIQSAQREDPWSKHRIRRAFTAESPEEAARVGARWVARVGGRDLVARFLADRGLTMMVLGPLSGGAVPGMPQPHSHHEH